MSEKPNVSENKEDVEAAVQDVFASQKPIAVERSSGNAQPTLKDFWAHRRVLLWCKLLLKFLLARYIRNANKSHTPGLLIYMLPINFGYEQGMVGNLLPVKSFLLRFGHTLPDGVMEISATNQQILNAGTTVGIFVSAFSTGVLSDLFGRRNVVFAACILCIGGTLLQYYSTTIMMLFGGKLLATYGFGLGHSLGPVYVAELAPTILRGTCLSLVVSIIFVVGYQRRHSCFCYRIR